MKLKKPVNIFLGPITTNCLQYLSPLQLNHERFNIVCYTLHLAKKLSYDANYRYHSLGGDSLGGCRSVLCGICNGINSYVDTNFMTIKGIW